MPANQRLKRKIRAIDFISFETGVTPGALRGVVKLGHPTAPPAHGGHQNPSPPNRSYPRSICIPSMIGILDISWRAP